MDWFTKLGKSSPTRATKAVKAAYLEAIAELGTREAAAQAVGLPASVFRELVDEDASFQTLEQQALAVFRGKIEAEIYRRAIEGWDQPVFHQGECIGHIRKFSDPMLELLAKRHIPEYQGKADVDIGIGGGVLVIPQRISDGDEGEGDA